MKRANLLLVLLLVGLVGCTYNSLPDDMATPVAVSEQGFDLTFSTRAEAFDGVELDSEYFVAEQDLESYLNYKQKHSGKKINIKNYSAYGFDNSHTLFYVINYDKGWEVVSADKRTQPTLAYGDGERTFSMGADNTNEAEKLWMEMLASDVLQKRQRSHSTRSTDTNNLIADEKEQSNVAFWNRVCTNGTRVIEVGSISDLSSPNTVYYVLGSTTSNTTLIDKGPYLKTKWGQGWPWNVCCPPWAAGLSDNAHSVVGCVAVAGGQLLHYLATEKNMVLPIPTSVSFTGYGNHTLYQMSAINFSTQSWGAMALTDEEYDETWPEGPTYLAATLLAWVGGCSQMTYGQSSSSAHTSTMMSNVFRTQLGIDYNKTTSYNTSIIRNEMRDDAEPILLKGTNVNSGGGGHAWIMDGYKLDLFTESVYYIVSDTSIPSNELAQMNIDDATHVINYEREDEYVRMNWGWDGSQDGFYGIMSNNWTPYAYQFSSGINLYYNFTK